MAQIITLPVVQKARAKAKKPEAIPRQWLCKRCKHDIGVETSEIIQIRMAPRIKGLKIEGGFKRWVCGKCYQRGVTTEVF